MAWLALRGFIVGAEGRKSWQPLRRISVLNAVRKDFARLMGIKAQPVFHTVYSWPKSMPQYVVGHADRVNRMLQATGLTAAVCHLTGNYFDGVGMPDTIRGAKEAAKHIAGNGRLT